jgi:hypothetical protein
MLARRSIQKLLTDSTYLSATQIERFVLHLNRRNRDAIEAEWELIVLAALASIGHVEHEPDLGGSKRLDIRFRSDALKFIADVTSISDELCHRENPVEALSAAMFKETEKLHRAGIEGGLDFRVSAIAPRFADGVYKTKLLLPHPHEFKSIIFDTAFRRFVAAIRQQPRKIHHHTVNTARASVSIVFNPGSPGTRYFSCPSYNLAHDVTHNVVHNALEDKSNQIKRAGQRERGEVVGVFLCDGGCWMLRQQSSVGIVSLEQVIRTFLRGNSTVDFVCVVHVFQSLAVFSSPPPKFVARVWSTRYLSVAPTLEDALNRALQLLPAPVNSAVNTLNHFVWAVDASLKEQRFRRF